MTIVGREDREYRCECDRTGDSPSRRNNPSSAVGVCTGWETMRWPEGLGAIEGRLGPGELGTVSETVRDCICGSNEELTHEYFDLGDAFPPVATAASDSSPCPWRAGGGGGFLGIEGGFILETVPWAECDGGVKAEDKNPF